MMMQEVRAVQMQWEDQCNIEADVILAADVLYDPGEMHGMA